MGQALYRTYRSKKLSEIVGQEHITTALNNALKKGTIAHAYLLTGPRGTGKTSIARILAHEINELPYDDDSIDLDIIEIDAASNRRIDEIRDLRDKVHIAPAHAKFKVYIIDEVHMLTREAFNALLKTLEEPPAHAVFILATTEPHKLPETIISRTQRYSLRPVALDKVAAHLKYIAKQEKISVADDALDLIAAHGEGSFRDSISLLDQVRNSGAKVTLADVQANLGIAPTELIEQLVGSLSAHNASSVAAALQAMQMQGSEPAQIARQLGQALRAALLSGISPLEKDTLMQLLGQLLEVPASHDPRAFLEIILIDAALHGTVIAVVAAPQAAPAAQPQPEVTAPVVPAAKTPAPKAAQAAPAEVPASPPSTAEKTMSEQVQTKPAAQVEPHPSSFVRKAASAQEDYADSASDNATEPTSTATLNAESWQLVLAALKQTHVTLSNALKPIQPQFAPGKITLEVPTSFLQKRINAQANKTAIIETIQKTTGQSMQIVCIVGEPKPSDSLPPLPPDDEIVHHVSAPQASSAAAPTPAPTQIAAEPKPAQQTPEKSATTPAKPAEKPKPTPEISAISNIFGGAELLQS